jgi:hypothetical protein
MRQATLGKMIIKHLPADRCEILPNPHNYREWAGWERADCKKINQ